MVSVEQQEQISETENENKGKLRRQLPPWVENPHRLVSWWDMQQFVAVHFHEISKCIQYMKDFFSNQPSAVDSVASIFPRRNIQSRSLTDEEKINLWHTCHEIELHCQSIGLMLSVEYAKRLMLILCTITPAQTAGGYVVVPLAGDIQTGDIAHRIDELDNRITDEMKGQLFLHILPDRVRYFTDLIYVDPIVVERLGPVLGCNIRVIQSSLDTFPQARYDLREAGNCFACERFTACVYHLMRVAEYGLVAVANSVGMLPDQQTDWSKMLAGIHGYIKTLSSKALPNWRDEEKKLCDLCSWFEHIARGWRNPVNHIPRVYSETTAANMFGGVQSLFEALSKAGIREAPMPHAPITVP